MGLYNCHFLNFSPMEQEITFPEIHRTITGWKDEVNSVREDIATLKDHLEKAVGSKIRHETLAHVEHFQNQFIRHKEVADELYHDLKQTSKRLSKESDGKDTVNGENSTAAMQHLTDRMHTFKKLFSALKSDFNRFMEKSS